jgi:DNA end-binding protein Ku
MSARAIWKAELCIGGQQLPVKLYAAVQDRDVHFRLLHHKDLEPVQQQMVDPVRRRPVPKEEIRKGIELEEGLFVIVTDEERRKLEPPPSRQIEIAELIDRNALDLRWFDRAYYLGPDGDEAGYFALAEALEKRDEIGIARWVMRKKRYRGAVFSRGGYLLLQTLRSAEEMLALEQIRPPAEDVPDRREQKLAEQLIATLKGRFEPAEYHDTYRERVLELIEAKTEGRSLPRAKPAPKPARGGLAEQLRASLSEMGASSGR